ncbi:MAG: hypothetical protein QNJ12_13730 [Ilumatobacter sp.]|uniref:hypothetical protein n=1 Tax=Ilumatobacter sp. TaxID=1967498 RepID=UPI0026287CA5|nr:hypothetical protein [Ilumatobacter sp.]MDJ0769855.1 hypothetical protein [Ilumatobacter sp.]
MEFLANEVLAPYLGSLLSPGVLAIATVTALVFLSGVGALAVEWCDGVGRWIRRQLGQSLERRGSTEREVALDHTHRVPLTRSGTPLTRVIR